MHTREQTAKPPAAYGLRGSFVAKNFFSSPCSCVGYLGASFSRLGPGLLDVAAALVEEPGPETHKVAPELAQRGTEFLAEAEAAHAARRAAALRQLKKSSSCILTVDAEALRTACEAAKEAGVEKESLDGGYNLLKVAEMRAAKTNKLASLATPEAAVENRRAGVEAEREDWLLVLGRSLGIDFGS